MTTTLLRGLVPTATELRASSRDPDYFPAWALEQPRQLGAANANGDFFVEQNARPAQVYPNCFIECWVRLIESIIARQYGPEAIRPGYGLDANGIYERFDDARHGDRTAGGQMHSALEWCPSHEGWFEDVRWKAAHFPYKPGFAERMLSVCPFVIGLATHSGWFSPSNRNGYITPQLPSPNAGHAIMAVDHQVRSGSGYLWAPVQWGYQIGYKGYVCLDDDHVVQSALSDCIALYLPDGIGEWWRDKLVRLW